MTGTSLSDTQLAVLRAMYRLGALGDGSPATAREIGAETGQVPDGAARTLTSLLRRHLVANGKRPDGIRWGYRLTGSGLDAARGRQLRWAPYQEFGIPDPAAELTEAPAGPVIICSAGYRDDDIIVYWIPAGQGA